LRAHSRRPGAARTCDARLGDAGGRHRADPPRIAWRDLMRVVHRLFSGIRALLRKDRDERELDDELRAFVEADIDARLRSGMTCSDATRAARAHIGSLEAVKDHTRDAGWESRLESVWHDL